MSVPEQDKLLAKVGSLEQENLILRQQLDYLKKQLYGSKSEKASSLHPELFDQLGGGPGKQETSEHPAPEADNEKRSQGRTRKRRAARLPDNLPTRTETVIPAEVAANPEQWRRIDADESVRVELEPGYLYLLKTIRPKYVRVDQPFAAPLQELAPPGLVPNNFWGSGLLAEIISNRYLYALPFYRQSQLFAQRYHVDLARSTMSDASANVAKALEPLYKLMKKELLATHYIGCDETPVKYLDKKGRGSKQGYYWVYRNANGEVLFDWQTNRNHHHLGDFLGNDFKGIIQSDGYGAYLQYASGNEEVQRVSCMAHIRRKFVEAREGRPELVDWLLKVIGRLYALEATLRQQGADAATRARTRHRHARPILKLLQKAVLHLQNKPFILGSSNLGKALAYAIGQLPAMYVYLEHGEVEIDNNLVENAIRPTAVGKKNHLFIGSPSAGKKSAVLYSLLLSAKACGVPPQDYLADVMERLPHIKRWDEAALLELTPARWAATWKAALDAKKPKKQAA